MGRHSGVLKLIATDPSLNEVFDGETQAIAAELVYAFRTRGPDAY